MTQEERNKIRIAERKLVIVISHLKGAAFPRRMSKIKMTKYIEESSSMLKQLIRHSLGKSLTGDSTRKERII